MKKVEVTIKNKAGLHARPSSLFVQTASKYDSDINVIFDDEVINGKSIMLLAAEQGRVLTLECDGEDEEEMIADLIDLIEVKKFNEE